jgi:hypothetical protein
VTLRSFAAADGQTDLVAAAAVHSSARRQRLEAEIESQIAGLLPFSAGLLERQSHPQPRWDDEDTLPDPVPGSSWPSPSELRLATRQPVYSLERAGVAALGSDGDLLLGWRAGDVISAELG